MWIVNGQAHSKFNIPHSEEVFFLVSYWLVFTFLVSYWLAFTFFLTNTDSKKYAKIITIHIMKVLGGLLCVFMMWRANLLSTINIMKAPSSLLTPVMKKVAGLC